MQKYERLKVQSVENKSACENCMVCVFDEGSDWFICAGTKDRKAIENLHERPAWCPLDDEGTPPVYKDSGIYCGICDSYIKTCDTYCSSCGELIKWAKDRRKGV